MLYFSYYFIITLFITIFFHESFEYSNQTDINKQLKARTNSRQVIHTLPSPFWTHFFAPFFLYPPPSLIFPWCVMIFWPVLQTSHNRRVKSSNGRGYLPEWHIFTEVWEYRKNFLHPYIMESSFWWDSNEVVLLLEDRTQFIPKRNRSIYQLL